MTTNSNAGSPPVNGLLLLALGLLIGVISGYAYAQRNVTAQPINLPTASTNTSCPFDLDHADEAIISGIICPSATCSGALATCHCDTAHQIKKYIKQALADGRPPTEVLDEAKTLYSF